MTAPSVKARWRSALLVLVAAGAAGVVLAALAAVLGAPDRPAPVVAGYGGATVLAVLAGWARPARSGPAAEVLLRAAAGSAVVAGVFALVVGGLGQPANDAERPAVLRCIGGGLAAGAVWAVVRGPVRRRAARLVHGEREDPGLALARFSARLTRELPLEEVLLQAAEAVGRAFAAGRAEVWTASGGRFDLVAAVPARVAPPLAPTPDAAAAVSGTRVGGRAWARTWLPDLAGDPGADAPLLVCPAVDAGEVLALVVAGRPSGSPGFSPAEERSAADLARRLAVVLRNARLDADLQSSAAELRVANAELQRSRARLVAASDAERRRIERDLHDGAQHHLVGLALHLGLARESAAGTPAADAFDSLAEQVESAIREFRAVARGIYPPLLAHGGPGPALADAAARLPAPITVDAAAADRHPEAVETAVYFACLEALQNAVRHAPGATVTLRLATLDSASGRVLRFEVADDGQGFDPALVAAGHGRTTIADRIGAVGGTVEWDAAPGRGTVVAGSVPVPG